MGDGAEERRSARLLDAGVLGSEEFYQRQGGSDTAWIAAVYRDVLEREPAPAEVNSQLTALSGGGAIAESRVWTYPER